MDPVCYGLSMGLHAGLAFAHHHGVTLMPPVCIYGTPVLLTLCGLCPVGSWMGNVCVTGVLALVAYGMVVSPVLAAKSAALWW